MPRQQTEGQSPTASAGTIAWYPPESHGGKLRATTSLFSVLMFISAATRLAAARREQRFAALRLAGAMPRQVSLVAAVEASVAAAAGVAGGFGLFFALRPVVAGIPLTSEPFFPGDLSLSLADIALITAGGPVLPAAAARIALRRVQITPLGVSRRVTPAPPRAWRVIPLLAGLGVLGYFAAAGHPTTTTGQTQAFLPGFLLLTVGLVTAGPWLAMAGTRVLARSARRPAALIAARRLADNPRAAYRAVSGAHHRLVCRQRGPRRHRQAGRRPRRPSRRRAGQQARTPLKRAPCRSGLAGTVRDRPDPVNLRATSH